MPLPPDRSFPDDPTVARPRVELAGLKASAFVLEVREGPDAGKSFRLQASEPVPVLLGTSPVCQARLSDPMVSRRHCSLEVREHRLHLRDLGSTNGTFVNDLAAIEVLLRGAEVVRVGSTALLVRKEDSSDNQPLPLAVQFGTVLGSSAAMRRLYPLCERLAASELPVVIEGETGTGKEQLAEALHQRSRRAGKPFEVFDCTSVASTLIESELFGHEKGAFTGSVARRKGIFERAEGGTLLIDEIGDLPLELQPKLLRALERSEIHRVGGGDPIPVDVRVLAATRRDLDREVQAGRFRDDLYHRIAVVRIELPPLRERQGDIRILAEHFARRLGAVDLSFLQGDLLRRWEDNPWPGNVRELRNAVARRLALGDLDEVELQGDRSSGAAQSETGAAADLVSRILAMRLPLGESRQLLLEEFEARYVANILASTRGNVTRAAVAAGVARRHIHRLKAKAKTEQRKG